MGVEVGGEQEGEEGRGEGGGGGKQVHAQPRVSGHSGTNVWPSLSADTTQNHVNRINTQL